jgi:hypothetical protein
LITDNFLSEDFFKHIQSILFGEKFNWYYMDNIDYLDDVDKFQFTHGFYNDDDGRTSEYFNLFDFLFHTVKAKELFNIKANLLTRTPKIVVNSFHTDKRNELSKDAWTSWEKKRKDQPDTPKPLPYIVVKGDDHPKHRVYTRNGEKK